MNEKPHRSLGERLSVNPVVIVIGVIAAVMGIFGLTIRLPDLATLWVQETSTPVVEVADNEKPLQSRPSREGPLTIAAPAELPALPSETPAPQQQQEVRVATQAPTPLPPELPPPTASPTPSPLPSPTPTTSLEPTWTPTAVPTSTPVPPPCTIEVNGDLRELWDRNKFGCPETRATVTWASWTPYERGQVVWRDDTHRIAGFFDSGWWQEVEDTWDGQSATPSRGTPPAGLLEPVRGTGWVWGTNETFFRELGWARSEQRGFCALVQSFERGVILRSSRVEFCKDTLYNFAREGSWPLDSISAIYGSGWSSSN